MRCIIVIALSILLVLSAISNTMALCACPFNYAPVCGSDGKTYGNKCALECNGGGSVRLVRDGPC